MLDPDRLDARLLLALDAAPDASVLALARTLGVARNTVQARLRRLEERGVVGRFGRRIDPAAMGWGLLAFVSIELSQTRGDHAVAALAGIPEVLEVHAISGEADLLVKVVARDTADLHRVTGELLAVPDVLRTATVISLREHQPLRTTALLEQLAAD
ncbi:Lrp/AsnC family transcriptional regulator [Nocardioides sp. TRM66260-LWL]|uniref:Lrp/AsnC family transcriptional regulator n=1 Tax=Nocardioides sp. TRM66260-LWL TaxID=2874478 RepID=UPI001CC50F59|nr:Lrp/AsnC family transcriptional regulator [Nocardioides sp. TRM66260-LWL]MBZ5735283.1 Lrp/AsnC family transcriptional regulator [Nocardioides sp. TRM66260-LWL]